MSDTGRKDFSKKAEEKLTPESQKSMGEKIKETATDAYDKVAGMMQPNEDKSATQSAFDKTKGNN